MKELIVIVRFLVGGLFVFSGLIKINDPVGTAIKMEEYFDVFATDFLALFHSLVPYALPIAVFICVLEVVIGLAVLLNYQPRVSFVLLVAMILFFTGLTFYSAYFNKVTDCGCFGDAIKLTPWQSFYKDVALLVLGIFLFFFSHAQQSLKAQKTSGYLIIACTVLSIYLAVYAVRHLPYIDFRAYKVGTNIPAAMQPSAELIYEYVMERGGVEYKFESYPADTSYQYKAMILLNPEAQPKITDFNVWNDAGDFTESMFEGRKLFVVLHDIDKSERGRLAEIAELQAALGTQVEVLALTASDGEAFMSFMQENGLDTLPFYYTDATVLKTIVRSNPGLWLMDNGTVVGKWHYNDIPAASDVLKLLGS